MPNPYIHSQVATAAVIQVEPSAELLEPVLKKLSPGVYSVRFRV